MNAEKLEKFADRMLQSAILLKDRTTDIIIIIYDSEGNDLFVDSNAPPPKMKAIMKDAIDMVSDPKELRIEKQKDFL